MAAKIKATPTPLATAYFIVRLDRSGRVYDYGVFSSKTLAARGEEQLLGRDLVVDAVAAPTYGAAERALLTKIANRHSPLRALGIIRGC